jgi:hypothetical protein
VGTEFYIHEVEFAYVLIKGCALKGACTQDAVVEGESLGLYVGSYGDGVDVQLPSQGEHSKRERVCVILRLSKGIRQENQCAVLGTAWTPTYSTVSYPCDNCAPLLWG